ncbi:MAG: hypothetical protein LBF94_02950 [Puniceicoccales bacterium]|jgi:hypothetical protein|nr:hypothetical protein [Puniceicoccales bacterium]
MTGITGISQVQSSAQASVIATNSVTQTIFGGRLFVVNTSSEKTVFSERIYEPDIISLKEHANSLGIETRELVELDRSFGRILSHVQNANPTKAREIVEEAQRRIGALEARRISRELYGRETLDISKTDLRKEILAVFREKAPEYIHSLADEKRSDISLKEVPKWLVEKAKRSNFPLIKAIRRRPIIAILVALLCDCDYNLCNCIPCQLSCRRSINGKNFCCRIGNRISPTCDQKSWRKLIQLKFDQKIFTKAFDCQ